MNIKKEEENIDRETDEELEWLETFKKDKIWFTLSGEHRRQAYDQLSNVLIYIIYYYYINCVHRSIKITQILLLLNQL
jgi:hypothetical protein